MKLFGITEGIVSTSRGRIVNTKNDIADALVYAIGAMGFSEPDVEYADSTTEDAILYLNISSSTLMIRIISDDDIQIQVSEDLARVLQISDYQKFGGSRHVIRALRRIRSSVREWLVNK